jgi:putative membrane protein
VVAVLTNPESSVYTALKAFDIFFFTKSFPLMNLMRQKHTNQSQRRTTMKKHLLSLCSLILATGLSAAAQTANTAPAAAGPTDPEIAHIVVTANTIDIDAGKLAESKTKNKEVKAFAKQMVTDHSAVNKQASDLAKKLKVTPADNDTSKSLMTGAKENMSHLKTLKGADFDKAYVDHEVDYHQAVVDAIDKTLIPSAKNAELKGLIEKVRPAIVAHLEHAKHLQSTLTK